MAGKLDSEHVEYLTLIPIGSGPYIGYRVDFRVLTDERHLNPDIHITVERGEKVYNGKIAVGLILPFQPPPLINGGKVEQHPEGSGNLTFKEFQQILDIVFTGP